MAPAFKDLCTEADMRRFALCFLHTKDLAHSVDWAAAAADYDSSVKPESFKTVTTKAINRVKKAAAGDGDAGIANRGDETKAKDKGKGKGGAKKRKATEDAENEGDDGATTPPPPLKTKRGKKAASKADDGEPKIKAESPAGDEDALA